jgi:hypothetical protein
LLAFHASADGVHGLDDKEEDHCRREQKIDERTDDQPNVDWTKHEPDRGIRCKQCNERSNNALGDTCDDIAECCTDDNPDCKVDGVALGDELAKLCDNGHTDRRNSSTLPSQTYALDREGSASFYAAITLIWGSSAM